MAEAGGEGGENRLQACATRLKLLLRKRKIPLNENPDKPRPPVHRQRHGELGRGLPAQLAGRRLPLRVEILGGASEPGRGVRVEAVGRALENPVEESEPAVRCPPGFMDGFEVLSPVAAAGSFNRAGEKDRRAAAAMGLWGAPLDENLLRSGRGPPRPRLRDLRRPRSRGHHSTRRHPVLPTGG